MSSFGTGPARGGRELAYAMASNATTGERQGITFDKWPMRLDVSVEYQDWILVAMCILLVAIWCLPCICGRMRNSMSRSFSSWVYTRLHVFFCIVTYLNIFILMFTIGVLPDWTANEFVLYVVKFTDWTLIHVQKLITSLTILFGFFLLFRFRQRIALAAGLEHITVFRFNWRDIVGLGVRRRPVEIFIWKTEGLQSSAGKVLKANDIFVECHMGHNEPMRTRVHNNAGSQANIRESFQLNVDESAPDTLMTLFIKDQALLANSELARLTLSTREICGIEDQTGKRRSTFAYSEEFFLPLNLSPSGTIWVAVAPVDDGGRDEERAPLIQEDSLVTC
mmetsp:Transcript_25373/g.45986  ORF Transcript_25373/g.45986 Transcript_25373/m.45986 type:complete len:336 (+) Transcript_25373:139-1146(+)